MKEDLMMTSLVDEVDRGNRQAEDWMASTIFLKGFTEAIAAARVELGRFNVSGLTLATCVRNMRLEFESREAMIDGLVREIVQPTE